MSNERLIAIAPRVGPPLRIQDLYWAAGFLEGEGWFGWTERYAQNTQMLIVSCSQVQLEPLERLKRIFGSCGLSGTGRRYGRRQDNPIHYWQVSSRKAAAVMMTLYTLMSPKRQQQITLALEKWKSVPYSGIRRGYGYYRIPAELQRKVRTCS